MKSALKSNQLTLLVFSLLAALYIFLYVAISLEDYALLVGSTGLFIIIAVIMYASRRVNWYELAKK